MSRWARRYRAFAHPSKRVATTSMQPEHAIDGAQFSRLDQLGMRDADGIERALELVLPELQEILERGKFRKQIVVLPDVGLQQRRVIRHPVENLCRGQPVSQRQFPKVLGNPNPRNHANLLCRSASATVATCRSHPGEKMRSHDGNVTHATNSSQAQMVNELLKIRALAAAYRTC